MREIIISSIAKNKSVNNIYPEGTRVVSNEQRVVNFKTPEEDGTYLLPLSGSEITIQRLENPPRFLITGAEVGGVVTVNIEHDSSETNPDKQCRGKTFNGDISVLVFASEFLKVKDTLPKYTPPINIKNHAM